MAPKRAAAQKKKSYEEDEDDEVVVVDEEDDSEPASEEEESEDEKPAKGRKKAPAKAKKPAAAKAKSPAKRKKVEKVDVNDLAAAAGDGEDVHHSPPPAKKQKAPKITDVTELDDGFTAVPPGLLYKAFGEQSDSAKIAAFDFDGTLVQTKSGAQFPLSAHDWTFYNDSVAPKLQQYAQDGYRLVIFTNQGGVKGALAGTASHNFRQRVASVLSQVKVSAVVLAATQKDEFRKPDRGMWDYFVEHFMEGVAPDLTSSFFVGDDIDGGDVGFAHAVGLPYRSEKEEFGERDDPKAKGGAGGGGAQPHGPVEVQGTGHGPNAELINIFQTLAVLAEAQGGDHAHFKVRALKKVADVLQTYPHQVTEARLKEVGNLQGVGKASIDKIKEYLATGTLQALSGGDVDGGGGGGGKGRGSKAAAPAGKEGKQMESKQRAEALQFM